MLSVIIVVLNNAEGLQKNLSAISQQRTHELDIIVIDGGSTDGTLNVIKQYKDEITYWESGCDTGISDAFNRGVKQAKNEYLTFVNSDDYWQPNAFQIIQKHLYNDKLNIDIYAFSVMFYDCEDDFYYVKRPNLKAVKYRMTLYHPSMIIKKSYFKNIGGYSEKYNVAMDSEWCHRAISNSAKFHLSTKVLSVMQLGGRSDKYFWIALWEYRKSLLENKINTPLKSFFVFLFLVSAKTLLKFPGLNTLKRKLVD